MSRETIPIRDNTIRLGQFLKLANLIESGSEAKEVIADGLVSVNGDTETRRGRQLVVGDVVEIGGTEAVVGSGDEPEPDITW
ncbi:RNA-binding protein [Williamsia sp. 1138]|uniref:RNA-binding S4 domain-containing protein n=1 Tax=Gordonia rubripertincta TaxID=36822 RepID=A0ABT4MUN0_GORRU|nr:MULTISPECIES: RNA-binding S4 domain-containing protein [Mycobacteriales]MCZ4549457.1 RNA-binding S4 domain-containing protein [Gordonia rubripertincta]OZG30631.1 RNA-binding protein [Williamsia sp. 1138]